MPDLWTIALSKTNCYLLKLNNGYLLVDCGNAHDKHRLLKAIHNLGVSIKDIRCLLLTHHHNDHCGLINFITIENPSVRVIMSRKCAEYLATGVHRKDMNERYASTMLGFIIGTYIKINRKWPETYEPYYYRKEDIIIEADDDSILCKLGINGKILMTPGHTDDCISLVAGQAAFVGDAARNTLNFAGNPYYPILIYDIKICRKSWKKLTNEGVERIYPAHGRAFCANELISRMRRYKEYLSSQTQPG